MAVPDHQQMQVLLRKVSWIIEIRNKAGMGCRNVQDVNT